MIRNYLKVTYRNLIRQKAYAFINIFSLSIGLACSILIGLYVKNEYSYDKFHKDSNNLYRVFLDFKLGTNVLTGPISPAPLASEILKQLPEADDAVRIHQSNNTNVGVDNKTFYEDLFFYADSNIFDLFNINFIAGNASTALMHPNTLVITRETSEKYFGTVFSVGKTLQIDSDSILYEVTGVVEPFPSNSHFHFNVLSSMSGYNDGNNSFWLSNNYYTYLKLKPGTNEKEFGKKLTQVFLKGANSQMLQFFNISTDEFFKVGNRINYGIQKVTDIHLNSNLNYEIENNGSFVYVSIFILVALFILLNACINFTNLATARSANRSKEVGLRKVLGSDRKNLIFQFLSESILISYIAVLFAILIVEIMLPTFNNLLNVELHLSLMDYFRLFPYILIFATVVGIISGGYPAFYLSSFEANVVIKNKFFHGSSRNWLRNILVVFQFTVSIVILLVTMLVATQLKFFQSKKLGFDKDRLIVVERTDPIKSKMKVFTEELKNCPDIENVSISSGIPGRESGDKGYMLEGKSTTETFVINTYGVNYDYLKTMGIELKKGRFFSKDYHRDSLAVVINESTARYLGLENPISKQLILPGDENRNRIHLTIVGVIDDFHYESLHKAVNPLLLFLIPENNEGYVNIRAMAGKEKDVLEYVNLTWKNMVPEMPLQYFYFDDQFDRMYKKEIETQRLMNAFALIAILIASLGLFGLVAFMAERRTKELGVRKVLGSSVWGIVKLLTIEITVLVLISYIIAAPLAYLWMKQWLLHFAYQTPIYPWIFVAGLTIAMIIAWLTVSVLAIKSATRNPIEALRYE